MAFDGTEQLTPLKDLLNSVVDAANAKVQAGTGTRSITTAGVLATGTVTFSPAYSTAPVVLAVAITANPDARHAAPSSITTTGFTINCINETNTSTITYAWVAIGS